MPTVTVKLPPLHDGGQTEVAHDPHRFKVVAAGRRWGKTILAGNLLYEAASQRQGQAWWVWPNFRVARPGWRFLEDIATKVRKAVPGVRINQTQQTVKLPGGGEIMIQTADDPRKLVGEGLVRVVLDECAIIPERAWQESIQPTLVDTGGDALLCGVPKGRNWFWRRYLWGQDADEPDWKSWTFTMFDNPTIAEKEKAAQRAQYERGLIPERIWRQEWQGEFIEDSGLVFRRVAEACTAKWQDKAIPGHEYVFGVDWAKENDYTVFAVWDTSLPKTSLVHVDRSNKIEYTFQVGRLDALASKFKPVRILAEKNSMGEPLIEQLHRKGLPVSAFHTSNASKAEAYEALALAIERGDVELVPDEHLMEELTACERSKTPGGLPKYEAPAGCHDDVSDAAAIGYSGARTGDFGVMAL
jgi:hypothetical protein